MIVSVNSLLTQGMIPLSGPSQFRVVQLPRPRTSAGLDGRDDLVEDPQRLLPRLPLVRGRGAGTCSVTMFRIGPTFWAIPPWTRTRLCARASGNAWLSGGERGASSPLSGARRPSKTGGWTPPLAVEQLVGGQQPAPADAPLGVVLARRDAVDQLDAREDPARVLPAAAGAAQPLAEDRPGDDHPRLLRVERPGQVPGLAGRPHQERDQRGQQVRRDRQPRPLGDVVDLADDLQPVAGPDHPGQQVLRAATAVPSSDGGIRPEAITPALTRPR